MVLAYVFMSGNYKDLSVRNKLVEKLACFNMETRLKRMTDTYFKWQEKV